MDTPPPLPPAEPSPRIVRALGWVAAVIGVLLCVTMAIITRYVLGVIQTPVLPGHSPRWTGTEAFTVRMFWLFGGVFFFGLVSLANGVWQVWRGSTQPVLRALLVAVGVALFVGAFLMTNQQK